VVLILLGAAVVLHIAEVKRKGKDLQVEDLSSGCVPPRAESISAHSCQMAMLSGLKYLTGSVQSAGHSGECY
jgi:hypothetical protein